MAGLPMRQGLIPSVSVLPQLNAGPGVPGIAPVVPGAGVGILNNTIGENLIGGGLPTITPPQGPPVGYSGSVKGWNNKSPERQQLDREFYSKQALENQQAIEKANENFQRIGNQPSATEINQAQAVEAAQAAAVMVEQKRLAEIARQEQQKKNDEQQRKDNEQRCAGKTGRALRECMAGL